MSRIIATYRSDSAPEGHEAVVFVFFPSTHPKRKGKLEGSHVVFHAPTEDEARERAEAWWAERDAAEQRKIEHHVAMAERRRKPVEAA